MVSKVQYRALIPGTTTDIVEACGQNALWQHFAQATLRLFLFHFLMSFLSKYP